MGDQGKKWGIGGGETGGCLPQMGETWGGKKEEINKQQESEKEEGDSQIGGGWDSRKKEKQTLRCLGGKGNKEESICKSL